MTIHILPTITDTQRRLLEARTGRITTARGELIPKAQVIRLSGWQQAVDRTTTPEPPSAA